MISERFLNLEIYYMRTEIMEKLEMNYEFQGEEKIEVFYTEEELVHLFLNE